MDVTQTVTEFILGALDRELPDSTAAKTRQHILDTIAAAASGSRLAAGAAGARYAKKHSPAGRCVLIAGADTLSREYAAVANAMAAHADETDDSNEFSRTHPGCSIVPSALAQAVESGRTGRDLVRAVALGYDIGCRVNLALWPKFTTLREVRRSTHAVGGMFGSAAAVAALAGLDEQRTRHLLSYTAQQVSSTTTWRRDTEHVEKAYVFAGHPAHGALFALSLVESGWSGVDDVFDGDPDFLSIAGCDPDPAQLVDELGSRFEIDRTNIKKYPAGSPAQAPVQGLLEILHQHDLTHADIATVSARLPALIADIVRGTRDMPDINLPYLLSAALTDSGLGFGAAHDESRFKEWRRLGGDSRITVVPDSDMEPRRQAIVEVVTRAGSAHSVHVTAVRGTFANPMTSGEVVAKAVDLMAPVFGEARARSISDTVLGLDGPSDLVTLTDQLCSTG